MSWKEVVTQQLTCATEAADPTWPPERGPWQAADKVSRTGAIGQNRVVPSQECRSQAGRFALLELRRFLT